MDGAEEDVVEHEVKVSVVLSVTVTGVAATPWELETSNGSAIKAHKTLFTLMLDFQCLRV